MRYIPQSKYSFEEICEQCYNAINRPVSDKISQTVEYDEVRKFLHYADTELVA